MNKIDMQQDRKPLTLRHSITALMLMCGLANYAHAQTETFTLKSDVTYGEEGIFFNTDKGKVALNLYTLPEKVTNSLHKYNLNKGACIQVVSSQGFLHENGGGGSGIQSISNCTAGTVTKAITAQSSKKPLFNILQTPNVISAGRCYMNSCSWTKTISTQIIKQTAAETTLKITVLGASAEFKGNYPQSETERRKHMVWNKSPHSFTVRCSYQHPAVINGDQVDDLPLNPESGVPGILEDSASLYFQYCHSYSGSFVDGIRKFGYHVPDQQN